MRSASVCSGTLSGTIMDIVMTAGEQDLLRSFLASTRVYIEFGSGGSTLLACRMVSGTIISVDSCMEWQDRASAECCVEAAGKLQLLYVDVGPVRGYGYPADETRRGDWQNYHTNVWNRMQIA